MIDHIVRLLMYLENDITAKLIKIYYKCYSI